MAASSSSTPLWQAQLQLSSFYHCKYSSSLNTFKFCDSLLFPPAKNTTNTPLVLQVRARVANFDAISVQDREFSRKGPCTRTRTEVDSVSPPFSPIDKGVGKNLSKRFDLLAPESVARSGNGSRSPSFSPIDKGVAKNSLESFDVLAEENVEKRVILKDRNAKSGSNCRSRREKGSGLSSRRCKDERVRGNMKKIERKSKIERGEKGSKKVRVNPPGFNLRIGLDMCSKRGDVIGAIRLYDLARREGIKMGQYHYGVLLYLCSSAATGVVQPAKSGSGSRSLNPVEPPVDFSEQIREGPENGSFVVSSDVKELNVNGFQSEEACCDSESMEMNSTKSLNGSTVSCPETLDELVRSLKDNVNSTEGKGGQETCGIQVSEDTKRCALQRGFEMYEEMRLENIPMNEAILTSVARMAISFGDGDMAFDIVNKMKELGITPRLRSYGPALSVFCCKGDVEKAFLVEKHMLENGVYPEEPELEALLRVSVEGGRGDKVYYLLHKLRTTVRQVSVSTADVIERWFKSKVASMVGKRKWDHRLIMQAIENGGGGWHGQGWLGKGKWTVSRTSVGSDGLCKCCGEKLVTIDLDPTETENFANSVASLAAQREKNSSFQKFQKWLEYYGPFEAVVDGANVGLYSQRRFKPSKVNAIANGIRQMLPSKRWPLIVLHNRRINGDKMDEPFNKSLIEKWKNADALYATPTGSNDDWYWLYAAIKFKCLIVTNDEMRDHVFQLLGNDFFPKWKERHQVHFSFSETGPVFHMPPPCSVVIQESEKGNWHIPITYDIEDEEERVWLCITRAQPPIAKQDAASSRGGEHPPRQKKKHASSSTQIIDQAMQTDEQHKTNEYKQKPQETYRNLKDILSSSVSKNRFSLLPRLEAAEQLGACIIDFQI